MHSSVSLWTFSMLLILPEYRCQLGVGLFESLLGTNQQELSPFNQNINLQPYNKPNRRPMNNLNPDTRVTLEEQKEKLEDILAKLQEMNKLKEEQRQKEKGTTTERNVNNRPNINNNNNQGMTSPRPVVQSTKSPDVSNRWKKVKTKKFMFQAQPVVPGDQVSNYNMDEFVYYIEK
uniref:Uncharacterized protein n=1 Tax=Pectinophora gossypiella TaxID=13191 RepID=A0A1E1WMK2_PECGO